MYLAHISSAMFWSHSSAGMRLLHVNKKDYLTTIFA